MLGGAQGRQVGPTLTRPVAAGDSIYVEIWGSYDAPARAGRLGRPLLAAALPAPEVGAAGAGRWLPRLQVNLASLLLGGSSARSGSGSGLNAFMQVRVYSEDSTLAGERRVGLKDSVPAGQWQQLSTTQHATQAGYVQVILIDQTPLPVYFDDLSLRLVAARGIQENHYDPWGLNLVGIETEPLDRRCYTKRPRPTSQARPIERGLPAAHSLPPTLPVG
ncbi:MAG: hypothetical protein H7330_12305 [Hymenobacteraceae bacterium]|nr:hypothetical protein [Hymenobacteraceae bacterium]